MFPIGKRIATVLGGAVREINIVCPTITPAFTAELVTNGNMETGDPPSSWNAFNSATLDGVADERTGGAGAQGLSVINGAVAYGGATQTLTVAASVWLQISAWVKKGTTVNAVVQYKDSSTFDYRSASATWANLVGTLLTPTANDAIRLQNSNNTSGEYSRYDDVSVQTITFSSTRSLLGTRSKQNGTYTCTPTIADKTQAGILICYADDNNYLLALVDRVPATNQARLYQMNGGTLSLLRTGNITYSAARELKVIINGTTAKLYYNGSQVGADATVTATALGKQVHGWTPYASNAVGTVQTSSSL